MALEKGLSGTGLSTKEALEFTALGDGSLYEILAITEKVRRRHKGVEVNLCSIVNAKSGLCFEDCSFCAQSVKYSTGVKTFPLAEPETILKAAREAEAGGAREFSIVTSGTGVEKERDVASLIDTLGAMKGSIDMNGAPPSASLALRLSRNSKTRALKVFTITSKLHGPSSQISAPPTITTTTLRRLRGRRPSAFTSAQAASSALARGGLTGSNFS